MFYNKKNSFLMLTAETFQVIKTGDVEPAFYDDGDN